MQTAAIMNQSTLGLRSPRTKAIKPRPYAPAIATAVHPPYRSSLLTAPPRMRQMRIRALDYLSAAIKQRRRNDCNRSAAVAGILCPRAIYSEPSDGVAARSDRMVQAGLSAFGSEVEAAVWL